MTDESRTVRLILDTSAIVGFVSGSIAVGELLAEIDAEHGAAIIPLSCLIAAAADAVDAGPWLDMLTGHPATFLIVDDPDEWRQVANVYSRIAANEPRGTYELAAAAWLALTLDVDILTRYPGPYDDLGAGGITLPFTD